MTSPSIVEQASGKAAPAHRAPGRPRSAEADRAIIEAIVEILVEHGYREITIDAVAARARVAKTTIYRRWPGKADMVVDAIAACKKDCLVEAAGPCDETVAGTLVQMLSKLACSRGARILSRLIAEMSHNEELAVAVREGLIKPNRDNVIALLRRGMETGELRSDLDPEVAVDLLGGPRFLRMLVSGGEVTPHLAEQTVDLVLNGIAGERARSG